MKKWHQRFRPLLTKYIALPSDIALDLPRVTLIGQIHAYIENHDGLVLFTESKLRLKSRNGFIQIKGTDFVLKMMLPKEILLEGTIFEVTYLSKE